MKFSRLALYAAAFLAVNTFSPSNVCVVADDVITEETQVEETVGEKFEFQAEVSKMMDIVVNSLYQNKDVFLRELISNASDALDKARFLSIKHPEILADKQELEVRISFDEEKRTLTITDTGIGMTKQDLVENLGTVAHSGTTKFMEALSEEADISQIGMFGVGFYSAFLVADKVTVTSKHPEEESQHIWTSTNGNDSFFVGEDPNGNTLVRGTEITLHLKEEAEEYISQVKLSGLVQHYSEFVTHPIFLRTKEEVEVPDDDEDDAMTPDGDVEDIGDDFEIEDDKDEEEPQTKKITTYSWNKANADTALWTRSKDDIDDEEYEAFFKLIDKEHGNATTWSHFDAEGAINFKALIYSPSAVPHHLRTGNFDQNKNAMKLYVRKVLISDSFELLPKYMSFIGGVIDSDDLPLNVNRETLQESKIITIIRKKVTRKVLDMIKKLSEKGRSNPEIEEGEVQIDEEGNVIESDIGEDPYIKWYENFAPSLKMGIMEDEPNRNKIAKLLRVKTSQSDGKWRSFADVVENMKEFQTTIFYIAGGSVKEVEESPFMDMFNAKGIEVIYFTESADEYMLNHLQEYDGKRFQAISKETIKFGDEDKALDKRIREAYKEKFTPLLRSLRKFYKTAVMRVEISTRLEKVPAIVSTGDYGQSANMEKIMKAQAFTHGMETNSITMKTLELNARHPIVTKLLEIVPEEDEKIEDIAVRDILWNILDTALLAGGFPLAEGKAHTNRMIRSLQKQLDLESMALLPEIEPTPIVEEKDDEADDAHEHSEGINMDDFDSSSMEE